MKKIILAMLFVCLYISCVFGALDMTQNSCINQAVGLCPNQCFSLGCVGIGVQSALSHCIQKEDCSCEYNCINIVCDAGYFGGGSDPCLICPDNATCPGGKNSTFTCNDGYEKSGLECVKSATTVQCPENYYPYPNNLSGFCAPCRENTATCGNNGFTCKTGYTKFDAGINIGYICCPNNATCTTGSTDFTCKANYYKSGTTCKACPANATCNDGETFTCNSGFAKNADGTGCVIEQIVCPVNNYLYTLNDVTACAICPLNATCNGKTLTCDSNFYQFDNKNNDGIVCCHDKALKCSVTGDAAYCQAGYQPYEGICCPIGSMCRADGAVTGCLDGYMLSGDACFECDVSEVCSGGDFKRCANGYYGEKQGECKKCPTNADCTNGPKSFNCNAGYYKNGNVCSVCPENSQTCSAGSTEFKCNANYYKSGSVCKACPANASCPAGSTDFTCKDGTDRQANGTCEACGVSKVCKDQKCLYCADGYYGTCDSGCTQCPSINGSNGFSVSMHNDTIYNSTIAGCYAGATPAVKNGEYVCDDKGAECLTDELGTYYFDSSDFNMASFGQNETMYGTCRATAQ